MGPMRYLQMMIPVLCLLVLLPRTGGAAPLLVVEASCASTGQLDPIFHRRLVAWRKGRLRTGRAGIVLLSLRVSRVIKGRLDPAYISPPVGVQLLAVVALDDAALVAPGLGARGRWRLHGLPDGTWYVAAAADVPIKRSAAGQRARLDKVRRQLASNKPKVQYQGLLGLGDTVDFALVPAMLGLLDSKVVVTNPRGMRFHGKGGGGFMPVKRPLGQEARRVLARMVRPLRTRHGPRPADSSRAWRAWWRGVLQTVPFPRARVASGSVSTLAPLPMNQTWHQLMADPRGSAALTVLTRTHTPVHRARNLILYLPLVPPRTARVVHAVPPAGPQWEPRGARAAWGSGGAAVVWFEERTQRGKSRQVERFLTLTARGKPRRPPRDLKLGSSGHMVLSALGRGWAVVYERRSDHAFYLQRLDGRGGRRGRALRLTKPAARGVGYHLGMRLLAVAPLGGGVAVAVGGDGALKLHLVDRRGKLRRSQRVDDPASQGSAFFPRLASSGKRLCLLWTQADNHDDRILARLYRTDGTPHSAPVVLAGHVDAVANLTVDGDGFRATWASHAQAPHQLWTRRLSGTGQPGPPLLLLQGQAAVHPLGAGRLGQRLYLTYVDAAPWPHQLRLKEIKAGD